MRADTFQSPAFHVLPSPVLSGYSYYDAFLYPIAEAAREALAAGKQVRGGDVA
jgi:hypothetical protein